MSAVGLANRSVEWLVVLVVDVVHASTVVPTRVRRRVPAPNELLEKLSCLLPVDDAREPGTAIAVSTTAI
jgi:hypothetical protein